MDSIVFPPSAAQRSVLFGVVLAAHVVLLVMLSSSRAAAPAIEDRPIVVDVLPMAPSGAQGAPGPIHRPAAPLPAHSKARPSRAPGAAAEKSAEAPISDARSSLEAPPQSDRVSGPAGDQGSAGSHDGPLPAGESARDHAASGESTTEARFDADYLRNPAPPYPAISRRMGEEGKVVLRVLVTQEGSVNSIEVRTSSGSARLDESALRTVRQWKFVPARRGDTAVQSWVLVPVIFRLEP